MRSFLSGIAFSLSVLTNFPIFAGAQSTAGNAPTLSLAAMVQMEPASQSDAGVASAASTMASRRTISLTLADAEALALKNQPRLLAEQFRAQAANKRTAESRALYFPQVFGTSPLSRRTEIVPSLREHSQHRVSPPAQRQAALWYR